LLFIPDSRKRPITESLLYKQIIRFFCDEGIEGYFDIVFISIANGVIEVRVNDKEAEVDENGHFSSDIFLAVGKNKIVIEASLSCIEDYVSSGSSCKMIVKLDIVK